MGHGNKWKCTCDKISKKVPIIVGSIGIGLLLAVLMPFWLWITLIGAALVITAVKLKSK